MKVGVKSLQESDYAEITEEVAQLEWLTKEFRIQCPTARIDACDTLGHKHRMWEWGRVLKEFKNHFGYPFNTDRRISVLDIGTAYSLIGPALSYLNCNVLECDVDADAYKAERVKVKTFLDAFHNPEKKPLLPFVPFDWILSGFGTVHDRATDWAIRRGLTGEACALYKFDVVMSISTIEHVETSLEKAAWKEMADLLKPGGLFIMTMDLFEDSTTPRTYDWVRYTNYSMETIRARVDEMKSYGLQVIGEEDYKWHGVHVDDGSFAWISMVKEPA